MELNDLYLDLLKRALSNYLYLGGEQSTNEFFSFDSRFYNKEAARWILPSHCCPHTVMRMVQLENLQETMTEVIEEHVPGDFIEAGVFRGGAVIFMRGFLKNLDIRDRLVWAADTFEGIPAPEKYRDVPDKVTDWRDRFSVNQGDVQANFRRYELLDDQVKFLRGRFADTFPTAPFNKFAIVRLDGDAYESTMDALTHLYPRLSVGGYIIIDDMHLPGCLQAVKEYREKNGIEEQIQGVAMLDEQGNIKLSQKQGLPFECFWKVERELSSRENSNVLKKS